MQGYHSPQVEVPIRLNTNEAPFAPPQEWLDEVSVAAKDIAWNRYPDRAAWDLRRGIAELHGVSAEQVFVANGSNEVLQCILMAYSGAGRNVTMFSPTYQLHAHIAKVVGANVVEGRRRADFTLDPNEISEVVGAAQPAVSFLCSPNNPTGMVEPRENIEALLSCAPGVGVVDEAYVLQDMVDGRGQVGLLGGAALVGGRYGSGGASVSSRCVETACGGSGTEVRVRHGASRS